MHVHTLHTIITRFAHTPCFHCIVLAFIAYIWIRTQTSIQHSHPESVICMSLFCSSKVIEKVSETCLFSVLQKARRCCFAPKYKQNIHICSNILWRLSLPRPRGRWAYWFCPLSLLRCAWLAGVYKGYDSNMAVSLSSSRFLGSVVLWFVPPILTHTTVYTDLHHTYLIFNALLFIISSLC